MHKQNLNVWGREFELEVVFDCYSGEEILASQKESLARFLSDVKESIVNARHSVEDYCIKCDSEKIGSQTIANIFKYVMPKSIYVKRTTDNSRVIGLMCDYKFDIDNGIAVVFKNEVLEKIGTQNIIL